MPYRCAKCGEVINALPEGILRCPVCAYKIMYKVREPIAKNIKAR